MQTSLMTILGLKTAKTVIIYYFTHKKSRAGIPARL
jgi:hypothetical protein